MEENWGKLLSTVKEIPKATVLTIPTEQLKETGSQRQKE